jgi:isocitrate dehydrogenase
MIAPSWADHGPALNMPLTVNSGSLILSGALLLEHLGWQEAADLIYGAIQRTISEGLVTYDLARQMTGAREVSCSQFGQALIDRLG